MKSGHLSFFSLFAHKNRTSDKTILKMDAWTDGKIYFNMFNFARGCYILGMRNHRLVVTIYDKVNLMYPSMVSYYEFYFFVLIVPCLIHSSKSTEEKD